MDFENLLSATHPATVESPVGLAEKTKYIFSVTNADPGTMAVEGLAEAMRTAMERDGLDLAGYPPQQGHEGLRQLIVDNLKDKRGAETTIENVFLTGGAGGAITTVVEALIDPGDVVFAEAYSYSGTLGMLLSREADVRHVATDDDGMDTNALEEMVKSAIAEGKQPKLIYCIGVYQNPMGVTLSMERREHMLAISHKYGIPIFENESYADFRIDGEPLPPSMYGMDTQESVIYTSSFTKLLGCGLRVGFCAFPEPLRERLALLKFGTRPSHLASMAVHEFLANHREEHIEKVRVALAAKRDAVLSSLGEYFPPECSWSAPTGGMMVFVTLPEGADTWKVLEKAVAAGVKYNPGGQYRADRTGSNHFRIAYSHNSPEEIREGLSILAELFHKEGLFD